MPLPDGSLDLINSDGVGISEEDDVFVGILYECDRVLRVDGHVVIFCALNESGQRFSGVLCVFVRQATVDGPVVLPLPCSTQSYRESADPIVTTARNISTARHCHAW